MTPMPPRGGLSTRIRLNIDGYTPLRGIISTTPNCDDWKCQAPPDLSLGRGFVDILGYTQKLASSVSYYKITKMTPKDMLLKQIDVFMGWSFRQGTQSTNYSEWLKKFAEMTDKRDVVDITNEDVDLFVKNVHNITYSRYAEKSARKAVESLMRFYMARSKNGRSRLGKGRPPHIDEIEQSQKYRKMGLSIRDIGKLMGKEISQVHRWITYPLESNKTTK